MRKEMTMDIFEHIWMLPLISFGVVVVGLFVLAIVAQIVSEILG